MLKGLSGFISQNMGMGSTWNTATRAGELIDAGYQFRMASAQAIDAAALESGATPGELPGFHEVESFDLDSERDLLTEAEVEALVERFGDERFDANLSNGSTTQETFRELALEEARRHYWSEASHPMAPKEYGAAMAEQARRIGRALAGNVAGDDSSSNRWGITIDEVVTDSQAAQADAQGRWSQEQPDPLTAQWERALTDDSVLGFKANPRGGFEPQDAAYNHYLSRLSAARIERADRLATFIEANRHDKAKLAQVRAGIRKRYGASVAECKPQTRREPDGTAVKVGACWHHLYLTKAQVELLMSLLDKYQYGRLPKAPPRSKRNPRLAASAALQAELAAERLTCELTAAVLRVAGGAVKVNHSAIAHRH